MVEGGWGWWAIGRSFKLFDSVEEVLKDQGVVNPLIMVCIPRLTHVRVIVNLGSPCRGT